MKWFLCSQRTEEYDHDDADDEIFFFFRLTFPPEFRFNFELLTAKAKWIFSSKCLLSSQSFSRCLRETFLKY